MTPALHQLQQWQLEFDLLSLTKTICDIKPQVTYQLPTHLTLATLRLWTETRNLLSVAGLVLKSAVFRTESRGGHYRSDYPETKPDWQVHTLVRNEQCLRSQPISEPTQHL